MTPGPRKLALTAHVVVSVGWLGAVAAFLVLSIAGLTSRDAEIVRGCYLAMDLIGRFIIVPLSLAALASGLLQSLGTDWGLLRHYWVVVKFVLTIGATFLLLLHQFTAVAEAARRVSASAAGRLPEFGQLGPQLAGDAAFALVVLLVITTLSVYKPWGRTRHGQRTLERSRDEGLSTPARPTLPESREKPRQAPTPLGLKIFVVTIGVILLGFIVLHLAGGGLRHHGG